MRRHFFEVLALLLVLGSLAFFWQRHDYFAGVLLLCVGVCVINVGAELARLALAERAERAERAECAERAERAERDR